MMMEEHDQRKQSISQNSCLSTSAIACKYCMNNDSGGDTSIRVLPCSHKFHHTSTNNWLLCNERCPIRSHERRICMSNAYYRRPRWLWVYQLMDLLQALLFKIMGTASWVSFNFQGSYRMAAGGREFIAKVSQVLRGDWSVATEWKAGWPGWSRTPTILFASGL
nr:hypothetical protein [Tanacetum cinerariifolium]